MSDSVQPHRQQPTRLHPPWDSPGKNTGVGCHFLLQCMKVKSESEVAQSYPTPSDPMDCSSPGPCVHVDLPGKSTGVECHCLLWKSGSHTTNSSAPSLHFSTFLGFQHICSVCDPKLTSASLFPELDSILVSYLTSYRTQSTWSSKRALPIFPAATSQVDDALGYKAPVGVSSFWGRFLGLGPGKLPK